MRIRTLTTKIFTSILAATFALATPVAIPSELASISTVYAAESTIVTMGNGTTATKLTTGEEAKATLTNNVLNVKVGTVTKTFTIAGMKSIVSSVKIAADDLLHIFLCSGEYYVWDLRGGVCTQYDAYRNSSGQYCLESTSAKVVKGSTADPMIAGTGYFWEYISGNSQSRELLVTRAVFEELMYPVTKYTVTFKDWNGTVLKTEEVEKGKNATPPANPTREGYTFKGWDKSLTNIQQALDVTAVYEKNAEKSEAATKYTVTFKDWNGTVLKTQEVEKGKNAMPPASPTREGYTFKGWDKDYTNVQSNTVVTAVYDKTPENSSTSTTNGTADTKTTFDIDFWWNQYSQGKITWDEFMQAAAQFNWRAQSVTDETSRTITYYFYDADGKLQRTEAITTGQSKTNEQGQGSATANSQSQGKADVEVKTEGEGGATGTAESHTEFHATTETTNNSNSNNSNNVTYVMNDTTASYHENNKKNYVVLTTTKNGKTFKVTRAKFNRKKGTVKYNGITYKNVKEAHFASKSHNLILLLKNGNYKVVPVTKIANGKIYKARTVKGKWTHIICGHNGLAVKITDSKKHVRGVKDAQAKFVREDTQDSSGTPN